MEVLEKVEDFGDELTDTTLIAPHRPDQANACLEAKEREYLQEHPHPNLAQYHGCEIR
ncbi:hypothetical protein EMCG_01744 [[Emmonsia] crescens]|uniref:Uncharacterized protein n=1 Tax=[Emmonsia] crescens TaxID=73230 RepID=A0A0G2I1H7_9EURO|nr:hypothetical protein EMCG_01744 [Emmonsia crescens UAMH 3008]